MKTNLTMSPFTEESIGNVEYITMPKVLISSEYFEEISLGAKMVYGVFLSRLNLSRLNNWKDEDGHFYIIYPIKELMKDFRVSKSTIIRYINELKKFNFINKKRRGLGLKDYIYLNDYSTAKKETSESLNNESNSGNVRNDISGGVKNDTSNKEKRKVTKENKKKNIYTGKTQRSCVIARTCAHKRDNNIATFKQIVNEDVNSQNIHVFTKEFTKIINESNKFSDFSKQKLLNEWKSLSNNKTGINLYGKKYSFFEILNILICLINKNKPDKTIHNQGSNTLNFYIFQQINKNNDLKPKKTFKSTKAAARFRNNQNDLTEDDLRNDILKYMTPKNPGLCMT